MLNAGELAGWMQKHKMKNFSGTPFNPPTQGKIERDYQTIKNRVLLENDCPPGDLKKLTGVLVVPYTNHRYHGSLNYVAPADIYFGCDKDILKEREKNKTQKIQYRRLQHQRQAA
jgi:hypothetical protein